MQIAFHDGAPLYLELPVTVELLVSHTEPGLQGDRSSAGTKPATLETGAEIQVPLFINTGDKLKVDSRDGSYLGRVMPDRARASGATGERPQGTEAGTRPASGPSTCCSRPRPAGSPPPRSPTDGTRWRRSRPMISHR